MKVKTIYTILLLIFTGGCVHHLFGAFAPDTIYLKKGYYLRVKEKIIQADGDTMIVLPDSIPYRISPVSFDRSRDFYDSIQSKASRSRVTRGLYNLLFTVPAKSDLPENVQVVQSEDQYIPYEGKKIGRIIISKLDVFGPTVQDTSRKSTSWLGEQANKIHVKTRDYVIRKNLLFKEGDDIQAMVMAENERLLRELPYIDNAKIVLKEISPDSVDVYVITKDLFPYGANFTAKNINRASLRLWNQNFAGFGHELSTTLEFLSDTSPGLRVDKGQYSVENIAGSFVAGKVWFQRDDYRKTYAVKFNRDLIPYKIRFAGGMEFYHTSDRVWLHDQNMKNQQYKTLYNLSDAYFGHDFKFFNPGPENNRETFLVGMLRFTNKHYVQRPFVSLDSNTNFHSYTRLLAGVGISKNRYYQSKYVYEFGRTEDIPYGFNFLITGGYEWGEFLKRSYLGFSTSAGNYFNGFGYLSGKLMLGGYLGKENYEDGALQAKILFISNLIGVKNTQIRNFVSLGYTRAINMNLNEHISLDDASGFADLDEDVLMGQQRLVLTVNSVYYLPLYVYGFRFSAFSFVDFGLIGPVNEDLLNQSLYSSMGFGIRFKNENLVIDAIELRFTFFPRLIPGYHQTNLKFEGRGIQRIDDYKIGRPSVINFE